VSHARPERTINGRTCWSGLRATVGSGPSEGCVVPALVHRKELPAIWAVACRASLSDPAKRSRLEVKALPTDLEALRRDGPDWEPLAIAMVAEALAAMLLDLPPRPGTRMRLAKQPIPRGYRLFCEPSLLAVP